MSNLSFSIDDFDKANTRKSRGRGPQPAKVNLDDIRFDDPYEDVQYTDLPSKTTNDNFDSFQVPDFKSVDFGSRGSRNNKLYMTNLLNLVGSSHNKKIKYSPQLTTKNGAQWWIDNYHPEYKVVTEDKDNDGIDEVVVKDADGNLYAINGYRLGKSNLSLIQPYYDAFPDKDSRRAAREKGITPRSLAIGKLTKGQKKINLKNPYEIEYVNSDYKETPEYERMKAAKTLPIIPTKRSAYQVFTTLIVKPVWEAFKQALVSNEQLRNQFISTKVVDGKESFSIKDNKKYDLPSPSMVWFSAFAYEKYVKNAILHIISGNESIANKLIEQVRTVLKNLEYRLSMGMSYNKTKYRLYKTAMENVENKVPLNQNTELIQASMQEFFKSATFKNLAKARVKEFIQPDNRSKVINALYSELINAMNNNTKLYSRDQAQRLANSDENINENDDPTEVDINDDDDD